MVYSAFHKLVRHHTQSAAKIISHFHKPCISPHPVVLTRIPNFLYRNPVPNHPKSDFTSPGRSSVALQVYPAFSYEFFLNPISSPIPDPGFEPGEEIPPDDSRTIRADSVKKKRKKKMNKHKLRKLRRRLRRKT